MCAIQQAMQASGFQTALLSSQGGPQASSIAPGSPNQQGKRSYVSFGAGERPRF